MNLNIHTVIDSEKCTGCGACARVCLYRIIVVENKKALIRGDECFNCGHCTAACPTGAVKVTTLQKPVFKTFTMDEKWLGFGKSDTGELVRLMASLRSCRNFSDHPVAKEMLEDLVTLGTFAPSGANQQEWSFTILPERSQVQALAGYTVEFVRTINRVTGFAPLRKMASLIGIREAQQYHDRYGKEFDRCIAEWDASGRDFIFYNAPAAILVGIPRVIGTPVEDAMLVGHNIRLAAHTMGLGTCLIGISVRAMQARRSIVRKMGLPPNQDIYAAVAVGWPSKNERYVKTVERRRVEPRYLKK